MNLMITVDHQVIVQENEAVRLCLDITCACKDAVFLRT